MRKAIMLAFLVWSVAPLSARQSKSLPAKLQPGVSPVLSKADVVARSDGHLLVRFMDKPSALFHLVLKDPTPEQLSLLPELPDTLEILLQSDGVHCGSFVFLFMNEGKPVTTWTLQTPRIETARAVAAWSLKRSEELKQTAKELEWIAGFQVGHAEGVKSLDVAVSKVPQPIPIRLVIEDITDATAYQLAIAEVIQSLFSGRLTIAPEATTVLYLTGTNTIESYEGRGTQNIDIRVQTWVSHVFSAGSDRVFYSGELILSSSGGIVQNYTRDKRIQYVRENSYKALSNFIAKWETGKIKQAKP